MPEHPDDWAADWQLRIGVAVERGGATVLADGRLELLEWIERCHSISEAARQLGISYRHAWVQVQERQPYGRRPAGRGGHWRSARRRRPAHATGPGGGRAIPAAARPAACGGGHPPAAAARERGKSRRSTSRRR